jgi:hypothetical protein
MTGSGQGRTGGPQILLIGGPEDASSSGITRIGADFGSVMMGPPLKDYDDFDIIVVWPDQTTFLLPETHEAWEVFRAKHDNRRCLPAINPQYWNFRQPTERRQLELPDFQDVISRSCVAPECFSEGYQRDSVDYNSVSDYQEMLFTNCHNGADALLLERILWGRCAMRLRSAVLAMTTGTILLVFVPDIGFDVPWLSRWLCDYIEREDRDDRRTPPQQGRLTPGSLEALANFFATKAHGQSGQLCLQMADPQGDNPPLIMDNTYQLGNLLLSPKIFTFPRAPVDLRCHPGWGTPANIATWPHGRNPLAILLYCQSGGAVVLPSAPPADRLLSLLRRWYRERTDPIAASEATRWSKNIFRHDVNRGAWQCKIAVEHLVELPDSLKGCGYYHRLLDQANWELGIPYEEMHYKADLSNINRDGIGRPDQESRYRLLRRVRVLYSEISEMETSRCPPEPEVDDQGILDPADPNVMDPELAERMKERDAILNELRNRAKAPKTKQENTARASVRNALNRVCDELRKRGAPKLANHLRPRNSIKEEVPSFIYTGQLNWERD